MKEKPFKRKYLGNVLEILFNDKKVNGYCTGYIVDDKKEIYIIILETDSGQIRLKYKSIQNIDVIYKEDQYTKYQHAKSFYYASKRCLMNIKQGDFNYLIIPYMVNSAIACEVQLKGIIDENGEEYKDEHNLFKLYKMLPIKIQKELCATDVLFEKKLKETSNIFVDFRFFYENIYKSSNVDMNFWVKFTDFLNEYCEQYLRKGSPISIEL